MRPNGGGEVVEEMQASSTMKRTKFGWSLYLSILNPSYTAAAVPGTVAAPSPISSPLSVPGVRSVACLMVRTGSVVSRHCRRTISPMGPSRA